MTTSNQLLKQNSGKPVLASVKFGASLVERASTIVAGLSLGIAFSLTAEILAMAIRT